MMTGLSGKAGDTTKHNGNDKKRAQGIAKLQTSVLRQDFVGGDKIYPAKLYAF